MIRFGIIGCGNISSTHADAIRTLENAKLAACCDINEAKGRQFAEKHNCRFYQNYADMLIDRQVDVVTIATPHYLHKRMSIAALKAGKHVICEKPMATTIFDGMEIQKAIEKSNKLYTVCFQNRFNPPTVKLKQMLAEQQFGKLKGVKCEITWHRDKAYYVEADWKGLKHTEGGGVLINQAIHMLDEVCWLLGKPEKIKGMVMTSLLDNVIEVEDTAMATAVLSNEIPWIIHASNNYSDDPSPLITLDFETAVVQLTMDELSVNGQVIASQDSVNESSGKAYWGNGHRALFEAFVNKLLQKDDTLTEFLADKDALDSLQVVCGIYASAASGEWVELD